MNTIVQSVLEANALPGLPRITHVSPVKLDTTALPGGSLVMLLFVDDAPEPRYVLRLPRTPEVPDRILTNYDALRALSSVPAVAPSVPSAVYCGVVDSVLASVETCVPGLPLAVRMRVARNEGNREELAHLFGLAARWVWQLHAAPLTPECSVYAHDMEACAYGAIGRLREAGLLTEPQSEWLISSVRATDCLATPTARIHGDFNPNNALLDRDDRVYVIDWEFSAPGWPMFDLFTLARTSWFHPAGIADPNPAHAQALWDPRTPIGRAFSEALKRYENRSGLGRTEARALFGLYVSELVAERIAGDGPLTRASGDAWSALLSAAVQA